MRLSLIDAYLATARRRWEEYLKYFEYRRKMAGKMIGGKMIKIGNLRFERGQKNR
jgi:hypothetical protein